MSTVSVVTPTYNHADLLPRAIESVSEQTYDDVEHVVVDDASTDGTRGLMADHDDRVRYIRKAENDGLSETRNVGIRNASGDRILFLDADDELRADAIESLIEHLDRGEFVGVIPSKEKVETDGSVRFEILERGVVTADDLREANVLGGIGGGLFERAALEAVGCFDAELRHSEDYDLYLRLAERYSLYAVDQPLYVHYTGFEDQLTSERGHYEHRDSIRRFLRKHEGRLSSYRLAERHYNLAHVCARQNDPGEAVGELKRAIAAFPYRPPYYYYLVATKAGSRQYDAARTVHETVREWLSRVT
ncbi:glycosyltransferase family 2 protein [Salinilacihabitans rarus]|uniref:glycosyltransferase family 2 protein n=1 Tax=Salinilacihabitans rarus TaxID=2961596 RepID=UPI0020C8A02E|nr:glycosyltransferase family 2 protein [Salinilacihabitans rarus]